MKNRIYTTTRRRN